MVQVPAALTVAAFGGLDARWCRKGSAITPIPAILPSSSKAMRCFAVMGRSLPAVLPFGNRGADGY
jgi:hypothetical protein